MARSTPYGGGLAFFDFIMCCLTCGVWLLVMLVRELRARDGWH